MISRLAKATKLTTCPTVSSPRCTSSAPSAKIATIVIVEAARVSTMTAAHQDSTGYCAASRSLIRFRSAFRLSLETDIALHDGHVAEHIANPAGQFAMIALDLALLIDRALEDESIGGEIDRAEAEQQRRHARVDRHRRRDQQADRNQRGQMIAHEARATGRTDSRCPAGSRE